MEEWVWLPCDKHGFRQLRDLVVVQPGYVCEERYIKCGCRYKAENPEAELAALRAYEDMERDKMRMMFAAALAPRTPTWEFPWWTPFFLAMAMALMAYLWSRVS